MICKCNKVNPSYADLLMPSSPGGKRDRNASFPEAGPAWGLTGQGTGQGRNPFLTGSVHCNFSHSLSTHLLRPVVPHRACKPLSLSAPNAPSVFHLVTMQLGLYKLYFFRDSWLPVWIFSRRHKKQTNKKIKQKKIEKGRGTTGERGLLLAVGWLFLWRCPTSGLHPGCSTWFQEQLFPFPPSSHIPGAAPSLFTVTGTVWAVTQPPQSSSSLLRMAPPLSA